MRPNKSLLIHAILIHLLVQLPAFGNPPLFEPERLGVAELKAFIPKLKQGGYVIYLRHASTHHDQEDKRPVNLADCKTQRNLTERGRQEARKIGQAIRRHGIPIGSIINSPYCRCKDTARLAFGKSNPNDNLYFAMGLTREGKQAKGRALRALLSQPPLPGKNNIIVSHTANLQEAVGFWPKPEGVAYIFKTEKDGELDAVAIIEPKIWTASLR